MTNLLYVLAAIGVFLIPVVIILGAIVGRQRKLVMKANQQSMRYLKLTNSVSTNDGSLLRLDKQIIMAKTMDQARRVRGDIPTFAERLEV